MVGQHGKMVTMAKTVGVNEVGHAHPHKYEQINVVGRANEQHCYL